jgi:hypothetical protein
MPTDDQLRAFYRRMDDSQLAQQKATLGKVTAEAHQAAEIEETLAAPGGEPPVPYDDADATRHARIISEIQGERRTERMLTDDAASPFSVIPDPDDS